MDFLLQKKPVMKKKHLPLSKKLFLSKETISALNSQQQSGIAGGQLTPSRLMFCITNGGSCNTIPPGQNMCIAC
jgi:hypothetical protein